jgi:hypothetical protein
MPAKISLSNEERLRRYKYSEKKRSYKYHHTEKGRLAKQRANKKYRQKLKFLQALPFFGVNDFTIFL